MDPRVMDAVGLIGQFVSDHEESIYAQDDLKSVLRDHGFSSNEISRAFHWIEEHTLGKSQAKTHSPRSPAQIHRPLRVLTPIEAMKITPEGYGALLALYDRGVIDIIQFEEIIDRALRMPGDAVEGRLMKRLASLVLFNQVQSEWREWLQSKTTVIQ
jgi:uncharacterized protein Smg (DUF494 family)